MASTWLRPFLLQPLSCLLFSLSLYLPFSSLLSCLFLLSLALSPFPVLSLLLIPSLSRSIYRFPFLLSRLISLSLLISLSPFSIPSLLSTLFSRFFLNPIPSLQASPSPLLSFIFCLLSVYSFLSLAPFLSLLFNLPSIHLSPSSLISITIKKNII